MGTRCFAVTVALLAAGCGAAAGSLDGKVQGHGISVKEAIFVLLPNGGGYLAAADQENLCAILNHRQAPRGDMNLLEVSLGNWTAMGIGPLVTGTYLVNANVLQPGRWLNARMAWAHDCTVVAALFASSGSVTVESLAQPGGPTQSAFSVDLQFGDDHLSGHLVGSPCAVQTGTACSP